MTLGTLLLTAGVLLGASAIGAEPSTAGADIPDSEWSVSLADRIRAVEECIELPSLREAETDEGADEIRIWLDLVPPNVGHRAYWWWAHLLQLRRSSDGVELRYTTLQGPDATELSKPDASDDACSRVIARSISATHRDLRPVWDLLERNDIFSLPDVSEIERLPSWESGRWVFVVETRRGMAYRMFMYYWRDSQERLVEHRSAARLLDISRKLETLVVEEAIEHGGHTR